MDAASEMVGWDATVAELMALFWKSLRAVTPTLLEARFRLGDDGWDAITESLFKQIVEESIRFSDAVTQREAFDLPSFEFEYEPAAVSHIEVTHRPSGATGAFLRYDSEYEWPDFTIVRCVGIEERWRLHECDWACVVRANGEATRVTRLRVEAASKPAAGAQAVSRPDKPAKQRMSLDEWNRWWKYFGQVPLRHMLLLYWDPIGCFGHPPALDEYDEYAAVVGSMLGEGATSEVIADYLTKVATEKIGMSSPNSAAVASRVIEWFDESVQAYGDQLYLARKHD